jgi:uracil phosphoribosyltransferase
MTPFLRSIRSIGRERSALGLLTGASTKKGVVSVPVLPKRAGIVSFVPVAHKACKTARIGVVGVFTPPVTG